MGASLGNLVEGSVGQPVVGLFTEDFERRLNGALDVRHLYRKSVKGIRKEDSLPGDPEGYVEKVLEIGISFLRSPDGEPGKGLIC